MPRGTRGCQEFQLHLSRPQVCTTRLPTVRARVFGGNLSKRFLNLALGKTSLASVIKRPSFHPRLSSNSSHSLPYTVPKVEYPPDMLPCLQICFRVSNYASSEARPSQAAFHTAPAIRLPQALHSLHKLLLRAQTTAVLVGRCTSISEPHPGF